MGLIKDVLLKLISGHDDFCCMCFKGLTTNTSAYFSFYDVVNKSSEEKIELSTLFKYLFKQDVAENMFTYGNVCCTCKSDAVNCYKFMKMCESNFELLCKAVNSIANSVNKEVGDNDHKTLFVLLDPEYLTSKEFYDYKVCKPKMVEKRIRQLTEQEQQVIICNGNSVKEVNKFLKYKTATHTKKKKINYDIPSVPDSDLMLELGDNIFTCNTCQKVFKDRQSIRTHCFKFHYPRNFKCSHCVKSFLNEVLLNQHINDFHVWKKCGQCGKLFKNKHILKKHKLNHKIIIICKNCNRVYRSKDAFALHISENICKQIERKKSEQGRFICNYCRKRYCNKSYLAKHIMYEHENAEGFRCEYCDKTFYTPSGLKVHTYKHTQEKNFECKQCNRWFVTKTSLLYHTRLHTGDCPYKCEHCNKAFLSASRRIDHVRRYHMAPSLECHICLKKFKTTGSLFKHKKRHDNPNSRLNYSLNIQCCSSTLQDVNVPTPQEITFSDQRNEKMKDDKY